MLRTRLTHPEILAALAAAGHGSRLLISDGNFPHATATPASARRVFLNLSPGRVTVSEVLEAVVPTVPLEAAAVMRPDDADVPEVLEEFRALLPPGLPVEVVDRLDFYELTRRPEVTLAVATGDQRLYANLLLTIGYIDPAAG
ncbi:MAG TPA: RbsD/FucU family protein [Actinomycetes bacterium]|jgi:L-fucose mutarotase|nr:RbsD/FucU family protein [Actinomycetota bacterium]